MSFWYKKFSGKILSSIFIIFSISISYFAVPKPAQAQWVVIDPSNLVVNTITSVSTAVTAAATTISASTNVAGGGVKQFLLDTLATTLARAIVQGITAQTVNWINSGFQGNPGFVSNPLSFFSNIADNVVSAQLNTLSGGLFNRLCSPFNLQVRLALINNYLYQNRIGQCTLGQMAANYSNWTNNFLNGGWNSWFTVTQNMQNNPYGAFLASQDELSIKLANQTGLKGTALQANGGFLNFQSCKPTPFTGPQLPAHVVNVGDDTINSVADAEADAGGYDTTDTSEIGSYNDAAADYSQSNPTVCTTQTPGSLVNAQLGKVFGSAVDQLNVTQSINQIANALITEAAKALIGGIEGGLRGTVTPASGVRNSLAAQLATSSQESMANQTAILSQTTGNVPGSLQYAAGLSNTQPSLTPPIDTTAIQNSVNNQVATFQAQHPPGSITVTCSNCGSPSTSPSGTSSNNTNNAVTIANELYNSDHCGDPSISSGSGALVQACTAIVAMQNGTNPSVLYTEYDCSGSGIGGSTCAAINSAMNP